MAVSLSSPSAPPASASLLATLRAITRQLETRRSLQAELDQALGSFLSPPSSLAPGGSATAAQGDGSNVLAAPRDPDFAPSSSSALPSTSSSSTCAAEALHPPPPSDLELQEVLKIAFGGLVEVKEEIAVLAAEVDDRWGRADLGRVVERVEGWESERVKATLEQYQLRRLLALDPSLSSSVSATIAEKDQQRTTLARQIQEELQEITAEIADLNAVEEEEKERACAGADGAATATA
ncbi:hypothetical protein JCM8097_002564 [Rhodosporidiobolus ruineniae]